MGILRFFLAFCVLITHIGGSWFGVKFIPGYICVEFFFVVSGYYMAMILSSNKYPAVKKFYLSRLFRLYPLFLFIAVLFICRDVVYSVLTDKAITDNLVRHYADPWWSGFALFSNLTMIGQDIFSLLHFFPNGNYHFFYANYLDGADSTGAVWGGGMRWNGAAWSIGLEIWFYLLVPFLYKLSSKLLLAVFLF